jgi:two-component system sensor histidine kinase/response regulator
MDMRMPVMDGYEATRHIKTREQERWEDGAMGRRKDAETGGCPEENFPITHLPNTKTRIIALTANAFEDERQMVLSAGCDDFVGKPFREDVLLEKVNQHLGVVYVCEENAPQAEQSKKTQTILTAADFQRYFSQMPAEWVLQLHKAAAICSDDIVLELVAQIPQEKEGNASLIAALTDLVDNFLFEKIIELTQPGIEGRSETQFHQMNR